MLRWSNRTGIHTLMACSKFYSILFFDSDGNHTPSKITNGLVFFQSIDDLFQSFWPPTEVKFPVCICTSNRSDILNRLHECSNVVSIYICTEHYRGCIEENQSPNHSKIKGTISLDKSLLWQLNAHTEAYHGNADIGQLKMAGYIHDIKQELIEQLCLEPHITSEE